MKQRMRAVLECFVMGTHNQLIRNDNVAFGVQSGTWDVRVLARVRLRTLVTLGFTKLFDCSRCSGGPPACATSPSVAMTSRGLCVLHTGSCHRSCPARLFVAWEMGGSLRTCAFIKGIYSPLFVVSHGVYAQPVQLPRREPTQHRRCAFASVLGGCTVL